MKTRSSSLRFGHARAEFEYWPNLFESDEALDLFERLKAETPWSQQHIVFYGKKQPLPRLTCWYGDPGASYRYSGIRNEPLPWSPAVSRVRTVVQEFVGKRFNSVLLNYYRDGADSLNWHSDDEPELGNEPTIASVSLGCVRRFDVKERAGQVRIQILLEPGSLLVMKGLAQVHWLHSIPKADGSSGRINLTFRQVENPPLQDVLL